MRTEDDNEVSPRRLRGRRRNGGGFGRGTSARSESLRAAQEFDDEVEEAIDPETVSRHVERRAIEPYTPPKAGSPRAVMNEMDMHASAKVSKQYRLHVLQKMLFRKIPITQIAETLGVSVSTIEKDRVELKKQMRDDARQMNIDEMVGNNNAFYDELISSALRIAGTTGTPVAMQLAALRTAAASNADRTRFLTSAGVFDAMKFRRTEDGSGQSDVAILMENTEAMLQQFRDQFEAFSFNDPEEPENMEL